MKEQWEEWKKIMTGTDKKVWIVTAAVILALAAAVFVLSVIFGGKQGQQDGICPYSYEQKDSGELVLTIDSSAVPDAVWSAELSEDAEENIEYDLKTTGNKVKCIIRGIQMGGTQLILSCRRTEPVAETVCTIEVSLGVQEDLSVEMAGATETEPVRFRQVDAQNAYPCYYIPYTESSEDALEIRLLQVTDDNWEYRAEGNVTAGSAMRLDGVCSVEILAKEPQEAEGTVILYNRTEDISYTFTIAVTAEGTLQVKEVYAGSCETGDEEGDTFRSWDSMLNGAGE